MPILYPVSTECVVAAFIGVWRDDTSSVRGVSECLSCRAPKARPNPWLGDSDEVLDIWALSA